MVRTLGSVRLRLLPKDCRIWRPGEGRLLAFYPLFPCLLRLVAYISGSYLAAGLIVSGIASIAAAVLLRRLVQLDYDNAVALRSVWFFLIFPTAYFLHVGYSESLFLALALGSVLAARTDRWGLAGLLGAFCWLTRATGAILVPTLAVEIAQKYSTNRRWNRRWLWIAFVPTGFAIYLLLNWRVTGARIGVLANAKGIYSGNRLHCPGLESGKNAPKRITRRRMKRKW